MKRTKTLALMTTAVTGVLVLVAGTGVAIGGALKPVNAAGQINACVQAQSGTLRVADSTADCKAAELPLTWQQQGAGNPILAKSQVGTAPAMPFYTADAQYTPEVIVEQTFTIPAGQRRLVRIMSAVENGDYTHGMDLPEDKYGAKCGPSTVTHPDGSYTYLPYERPTFQAGMTTRINGVQTGGFGTSAGFGPELLSAEQLLSEGTYRITVEAAPTYCNNIEAAGSLDPAPTAEIVVFDQGRI